MESVKKMMSVVIGIGVSTVMASLFKTMVTKPSGFFSKMMFGIGQLALTGFVIKKVSDNFENDFDEVSASVKSEI